MYSESNSEGSRLSICVLVTVLFLLPSSSRCMFQNHRSCPPNSSLFPNGPSKHHTLIGKVTDLFCFNLCHIRQFRMFPKPGKGSFRYPGCHVVGNGLGFEFQYVVSRFGSVFCNPVIKVSLITIHVCYNNSWLNKQLSDKRLSNDENPISSATA